MRNKDSPRPHLSRSYTLQEFVRRVASVEAVDLVARRELGHHSRGVTRVLPVRLLFGLDFAELLVALVNLRSERSRKSLVQKK